eukprot:1157885-Pelagomonas_calceolata.AAC.2
MPRPCVFTAINFYQVQVLLACTQLMGLTRVAVLVLCGVQCLLLDTCCEREEEVVLAWYGLISIASGRLDVSLDLQGIFRGDHMSVDIEDACAIISSYQTILLGVGWTIYTGNTLEQFRN